MKCCNFASLDPAERARGIRGLSGASQRDAEIFERLAHDIEALDFARIDAARRLRTPLIGSEAALSAPGLDEDAILQQVAAAPGRGDWELRAQRSRRYQALFRKIVLVSYESKCAVCHLRVAELLDAAHIVPWSAMPTGRLDPANGLSLCALHHRAYDRGLMTVDNEYRIVVAQTSKYPRPADPCGGLQPHTGALSLPQGFSYVPMLASHRETFFDSLPDNDT